MKTLATLLLLSSLTTLNAFAYGGGSSVGTGNPAAKFCVDLGGQLESFSDPHGEGSNCVIEEWNLFRAMSKQNLVKPIQCGPNPCMPNPAAKNCDDIGGKYRLVSTPQGEDGMCAVEEWALWKVFH